MLHRGAQRNSKVHKKYHLENSHRPGFTGNSQGRKTKVMILHSSPDIQKTKRKKGATSFRLHPFLFVYNYTTNFLPDVPELFLIKIVPEPKNGGVNKSYRRVTSNLHCASSHTIVSNIPANRIVGTPENDLQLIPK